MTQSPKSINHLGNQLLIIFESSSFHKFLHKTNFYKNMIYTLKTTIAKHHHYKSNAKETNTIIAKYKKVIKNTSHGKVDPLKNT